MTAREPVGYLDDGIGHRKEIANKEESLSMDVVDTHRRWYDIQVRAAHEAGHAVVVVVVVVVVVFAESQVKNSEATENNTLLTR